MYCFLHAADIHLDSPLQNLQSHDGAPVQAMRMASRRAFDNLVQLALDEKVAFVLLAGDCYDGTWKDYNTGLYFIDRMRRLREAGIRVVMVSGNHDAASRITRSLRLPDNVAHFSSRKPETLLLDNYDVAIHGRSYPRRAVQENLSLNYPAPEPHCLNIGLLHTALAGRPGHEPYAPCSREDLINKGYDYWALGHVHQREEVCRDPWIVFSGNIQARHIRERGSKGATLVSVNQGRVDTVEHRDLDVVRWALCRVDCSGCPDPEAVLDRVGRAFAAEIRRADGRPLAIRMELEGRCAAHGSLVRHQEHFLNEFRGLAIDYGDIWLEKVIHGTRPEHDPGLLEIDSPLAGIMAALDEGEELARVVASPPADLEKLFSSLPSEMQGAVSFLPDKGADLTVLRGEVRDLLLSCILDRVKR